MPDSAIQPEAAPEPPERRRHRSEPVGFEDPEALVSVADARGKRAAHVRLAPSLAIPAEAPSTVELEQLGLVRQAHLDRLAAEEAIQCAKRHASTGEREQVAEKRSTHAQDAFTAGERELAGAQAALEPAAVELHQARDSYRALPSSERVAEVFGDVRRLEVGVLLAAGFDAITQAKPLEASGLAEHAALWLQIAATAGAIWFVANVLGWLAGTIALACRRDRRRLGYAAFGFVGAALTLGFVMLGIARHAWTGEQNRALLAAAHDAVGVPSLLDPSWLTCFQIAVAGAAVVGVGMYVLSAAGRAGRATIAEAEARLGVARERVTDLEDQLGELRRAREAADAAINEVRAEGLEAGVASELVARKWAAERAAEAAATRAAVARKDHMYWTEEKAFANGDCWLAQRPDPPLSRRARNPERSYRRGEAPIGSSQDLDSGADGVTPGRAVGRRSSDRRRRPRRSRSRRRRS